MNTFCLHLLSLREAQHIDNVAAFTGTDASGQFALRARHERFVAVLEPGLARLRRADGGEEYVAQPGAVLRFVDNAVQLVARDFLRSSDLATVNRALAERFASDERALREVRERLLTLEREMLRRLWRLQRGPLP